MLGNVHILKKQPVKRIIATGANYINSPLPQIIQDPAGGAGFYGWGANYSGSAAVTREHIFVTPERTLNGNSPIIGWKLYLDTCPEDVTELRMRTYTWAAMDGSNNYTVPITYTSENLVDNVGWTPGIGWKTLLCPSPVVNTVKAGDVIGLRLSRTAFGLPAHPFIGGMDVSSLINNVNPALQLFHQRVTIANPVTYNSPITFASNKIATWAMGACVLPLVQDPHVIHSGDSMVGGTGAAAAGTIWSLPWNGTATGSLISGAYAYNIPAIYHIADRFNWRYQCAGVSGRTSVVMQEDFPTEVTARHPANVIISIGANDLSTAGTFEIGIAQVNYHIYLMIDEALDNGIVPRVTSILPLPQSKEDLIPGIQAAAYQTNLALEELCASHNVQYIDCQAAFGTLTGGTHYVPNMDLYNIDGHLNAAGHQAWATIICDEWN